MKQMISDEKRIIKEICLAETTSESLEIFEANKNLLKDCKFIFTSRGNTNIPEYSRHREFSHGAGVYNIFASEKLVVLDQDILQGMKRGSVTYSIDYSISLDSMAVSYLRPYLNKREKSLPKDFKEIFYFLAREDVNIDPMPFMIENTKNIIKDKMSIDSIFEILKCYEILKTIDVHALNKEDIVCSTISDGQIRNNALLNLEIMFETVKNKEVYKYINNNYLLKYCVLLKIVLIQLTKPSETSDKKLLELLDFCDLVINRMLLREIVIASKYFKIGQNLAFFGKIQKGRQDLLDKVKNMAWDLYHIAEMERTIAIGFGSEANYFMASFLTFDKGLIELLQLYKIDAMGFSQNSMEIVPVADIEKCIDSTVDKDNIGLYFTKEKELHRSKRLSQMNSTNDIKVVIQILEERLRLFMK